MSPVFHNDQATLRYKDHTISCQITLSPDSQHFLPAAIISWKTKGRLIVYFLRSEKECATGEDANDVALEEAKLWIDGHQVEGEL